MHLAKNFSIAELTATKTGLYNTPGQAELEKLLYLCQYILQPLRDKFGPVWITSGFRSRQVNEKIGGALTSQHLLGEAADIVPIDAPIDDVFGWAKDNLRYGQIILEKKDDARWIHISLPRVEKQNMQAMTFNEGIYTNV